jgi:hypothetical protein
LLILAVFAAFAAKQQRCAASPEPNPSLVKGLRPDRLARAGNHQQDNSEGSAKISQFLQQISANLSRPLVSDPRDAMPEMPYCQGI